MAHGLVLACVELSPLIKKAEDFKEIIELVAKSYSLAQSRAGTYCDENAHIEIVELPHARTVRRWQQKIDLYSMLYRRWQWEQDHFEGVFFYICSDASPQWNYE